MSITASLIRREIVQNGHPSLNAAAWLRTAESAYNTACTHRIPDVAPATARANCAEFYLAAAEVVGAWG